VNKAEQNPVVKCAFSIVKGVTGILHLLSKQPLPFPSRQFILLLFLFLTVTKAHSQITRVNGTVKDAETKELMPFVNILFKGTTVGGTSELDGAFEVEIQKPSDTIIVAFLGYKPQRIGIKRFKNNLLNIELQPDKFLLTEFVVVPGENPAHVIMREVVAHKKENDPVNIKSYQYKMYNKIQFDINNYGDKMQNARILKPMNFVFDYADTTEDGKAYLPMALTETYSEVYSTADPNRKQEFIVGSQISGLKNASISQYLGDMYQNINIYDNYLLIFNRSFVSPVTDNFLRFYKYYLVDSVYIGEDRCYKLLFLPKRKQDLTFTGDIYIHDSTFAVKQVNIRFNDNANINYIKQFSVYQEYEWVEKESWMLKAERTIGDFAPFEKANGMGVFGRKTTIYSDFHVNEKIPDSLFTPGRNIVISDSAENQNELFWNGVRSDSLTQKEKNIYTMVDSLKNVPRLVNARYLTQMLATGYLKWDKFLVGQYYTFCSWNEIEGVRLKFGGITDNSFSTRLELRGSLAYGLKDERFKPRVGVRWFVSKDKTNRRLLSAFYRSDLEQLSLSSNTLQLDNILTSLLRRQSLRYVTNVEELKVSMEYEYFPGLLNKLTVVNRKLTPLGTFAFEREEAEGLQNIKNVTTTEISLQTRFAWGEKYISGEFDRVSTGSKYPVIQLELAAGVPNVFGSDFSYYKVKFRIADRFRFQPFGYTDYLVDVGKVWGTAPYLFLEIHQGSQTYTLDQLAFNMMNIFEFASDRYVYLFVDHHFEGYFLNKIPLLRKLKWREVVTLKSVIGDMRPENINQLIYPGGLDPRLYRPYLESGFAIENIFKIVRVDALWRMTHLDNPATKAFGLRISIVLRF